ncbi:MAG: ATP-binding protein, partial [Catenibacillus sp.]
MANINVLDSETINKIAAGEVVERPASVVKELVENAIDAHASAITVEIRDGGTSLIRITDNGSGIEADDIPLAFLRHSTSKIRSVEDLAIISS